MKTILKFLSISLLLISCKSLNVSKFDSYSFEKTNELKAKTHQMIINSKDNFANHSTEAENLLTELNTQYVYEKGRLNNTTSIEMWEALSHNESSIVKSYIKLWKSKEKMTPYMIEESTKQCDEAFDKIILLESNKPK
ncbi:MAG: hypothetical protein QM535_04845 [Limnohabitans sp.]|nr:hypothetical protein [Limnohabitans sp.]